MREILGTPKCINRSTNHNSAYNSQSETLIEIFRQATKEIIREAILGRRTDFIHLLHFAFRHWSPQPYGPAAPWIPSLDGGQYTLRLCLQRRGAHWIHGFRAWRGYRWVTYTMFYHWSCYKMVSVSMNLWLFNDEYRNIHITHEKYSIVCLQYLHHERYKYIFM